MPEEVKKPVEKKKLWEIHVSKVIDEKTGAEDKKMFNVLARTINAAFSKANKYKKDNSMSDHEIMSVICIAVVDY